ncbi:UDP-N-acetylglucosamine--N-acetylmuramyl-(pentapeptide) pyrophosphoryl-undecaprenol N-acetylglucosamine transferase [Enterococcus sp. PF1-24]|uniref:undecaprenyldiphospho-muramoylpentapeptide beta-N-acetylglucosaminyltransferase n=1 Tax=unclassified Enterococcus TaxID=2608891 RepID=UPI002473F94A|nr:MULTISPECIES: undecaprenyldiphospho-muramoylpentapeptide beta-N-acetylglucosaminyltransferase [unclassified Enterococcus]MDH6364445.1 UDP-N-acetylglucosamine--N-acetylmuramyl-(pentapeptide) pyrophosphoryl-undecaprenol N-acetylglucosamine transferase [Enterococcus sp. PFB1-1]MDH6401532.1 UDP-N-acetylglucosamine--N-acetylmuramyl-(pentapeptide) pyrophosphoryl-undecaprenol N-acetylglucosamine transferase [Enterococcus sp. PF1-24]
MKILVTGGGTGGHIYPALAFVKYMQAQDSQNEFLYIGAKRGLETKIVPEAKIPFESLEIQGFKRKLSLDNLKTVQLFFKSIKQAKRILREFKPDVVIGTGGYVSGAVVYAAAKMKIPTIVHEQNSVPGITNKFLSRYVSKVAICFADAAEFFPKEKVVLVGNPRGQEVVNAQPSDILTNYNLQAGVPTVLIFGGSQGALKINQAVIEALPELSQRKYQVLYASGERYFETLQKALADLPGDFNNISIQPYINQMTEVMANIDLLVGRAGATSIAEFTALGLPAVLIPSPYVTNDHQTKNAQSLVKAGAVEMIADAEFTGAKLVAALDEIMNNQTKREQMATASKKEGIVDASQRLETLVKEIIKK